MSENGSTTHKISTENGSNSHKTSTENSQKSSKSPILPDFYNYEEALFKFGTQITGDFVNGRFAGWCLERHELLKEVKESQEEEFRKEFLDKVKNETCDYVVPEVMDWVTSQGLEDYFNEAFVVKKVCGDEDADGKGRKGWFKYWMSKAQMLHRYKNPNEERIARRKALDKKIVDLFVQDGMDRKQVAKIIGVTLNHVDKVLRRNNEEN